MSSFVRSIGHALSAPFAVAAATQHELGFDAILAGWADRTSTTRGRELLLGRRFLDDEQEIRLSLQRIEQARTLGREQQVIPVGGADDVRVVAARAAKAAVLGGEELCACHRLMRAAIEVRSFLRVRRELLPELALMGAGLADFAALAARIDYMLEPSGRVRDEASEALATYRRRARGLHSESRRRIEGMLADTTFAVYLQDRYFSVRAERYVLPVNASFRARVPGIVHNASQTGQTLFIEPQALVDLGNDLAICESLTSEEEQRILAELSESVGDRDSDLCRAVDVLAEIDQVQAAARLAEDIEAEPAELAPAAADLELRQLRHPVLLLQRQPVVANDVLLRAPAQALVVSGPNAGGKTVSITGVGLCALMTRAGLPIPVARGSRMPVFAGVASVIGDAQDLSRGLSTFSAHLGGIAAVMQQARAGWLVLIDEIAADTDPTQGAALARAILEQLTSDGARVLVTTHLDEVKALGLVDEHFVNARVGLDPTTFAPTYRLELGAAGASSALEMAARVGLPKHVIERASEYLRGDGLLATALHRLAAAEQQALEQRQHLQVERDELGGRAAELAQAQDELRHARGEVELRVRAELAEEFEARRRELGELIAELQSKPNLSAAQKAQRRAGELTLEVEHDVERVKATMARDDHSGHESGVHAPGLAVGGWVKVISLGQEGRVIALQGKSATIEVGALHTRARLSDLIALTGPTAKSQRAAHGQATRGVVRQVEREVEARCDVRGLRADEALHTIERFLDEHYLAGSRAVLIVHGHGEGVLKQLVREALDRSPYVLKAQPGDRHQGGDGVTVVELDH